MKLLLILLAFIFQLCPPLKSQGIDSLIKYESRDIELKSSSLQDNEGFYYECISKNLQAGDQLFISYQSGAYPAAAYVKRPDGRIQDVRNMNDASASASFDFTFTAEERGQFEFFFTTKKPYQKGKANLQLFYTNNKKAQPDPLWTTCQKLDFVLNLAHTDFEFVPMKINTLDPNTAQAINCNIFLEAPASITGIKNASGIKTYKVVYTANLALATSKIIIKDVDNQLRKCMGDDWTIEESETGAGKLQEITYTRKGDYKYEFNSFHKQMHLRDKICLKTIKTGNDLYEIVFEIY